MCKKQGLTTSAALKGFTKPHYLNVKTDQIVRDMAVESNKAICRAFVIRFEEVVRARGESVSGALIALRARGVVVSHMALYRFKRGEYDNFSGITLNYLAQYAGFKSFVHALPDHLKY